MKKSPLEIASTILTVVIAVLTLGSSLIVKKITNDKMEATIEKAVSKRLGG